MVLHFFIRRVGIILGLLLFMGKGYAQTKSNQPNVIIIFTDDQGYGDFSVHGNPILKTPALDKLHEESLTFTDFHTSPLCTPSRGELLTGLDALHNKAATVGTGRDMMRRDIITMPEVFKQNGYATGLFGKWHLGDNYPDRPMDRGFDKCIWFKGWGLRSEAEYDNDYMNTRYLDGLETKYSDQYCTDLWFDKAMDWMGEMANRKQPFFVYLPTNAPHGPFIAPKKDVQVYLNQVEDRKVAQFFGMVKNIDDNMNRLDVWLEEKGLKDNTIVVYMNDNGGAGGVEIFNAGMRGKKGDSYEGGHRGACFLRWPKGVLSPRQIEYSSRLPDLLPTFIDLLKLKVKGKHKFDGRSLKSLLTKEKARKKNRKFVVQYGTFDFPRKYTGAVIWNNWRLVGKDELYDIKKDPHQDLNLIEEFPKIAKKMQKYYEKWWKKIEPEIFNFIPIYVGTENQNSVQLTSDSWANKDYVNTQWAVANAMGPETGGVWHLKVAESGNYRLELSRWPLHLNRALNQNGPSKAIGGNNIREGKALPIVFANVSLNNEEAITVRKENKNSPSIILNLKLDKGENTLQAWFSDKGKEDVCGAYYVKITKN